jgi:hypothetical protein
MTALNSQKRRGSTTLVETAIISATVGIVFFTSSQTLSPTISTDYVRKACTFKNQDLLATDDEEWDPQAECSTAEEE